MSSLKQSIAESICGMAGLVRAFFVLNVILLILILFPLVFLEQGTRSYTLAMLDAGILLAGVVFFGSVLRFCGSRES